MLQNGRLRTFAHMAEWKTLASREDFYTLMEESLVKPQIIFKDSTRCGVSAFAKERLRAGHALIDGKADVHYLSVLEFRSVSDLVAKELKVIHQSPQIIVVKDRKAVWTTSHNAIDAEKIAKYL